MKSFIFITVRVTSFKTQHGMCTLLRGALILISKGLMKSVFFVSLIFSSFRKRRQNGPSDRLAQEIKEKERSQRDLTLDC